MTNHKPTSGDTKLINPLVFAVDADYVAAFNRRAPKNLRIVLHAMCHSRVSEATMTTVTHFADALRKMIDDKLIAGDYSTHFPPEVESFRCDEAVVIGPDFVWTRFPNACERFGTDEFVCFVSFSDGEATVMNRARAVIGLGVLAVQEATWVSGSSDPATHTRSQWSIDDAVAFETAISNLYVDNIGVWCESLVPLWTAVMNTVDCAIQGPISLIAAKKNQA